MGRYSRRLDLGLGGYKALRILVLKLCKILYIELLHMYTVKNMGNLLRV